MTMLISDKTDFKIKIISRDKEGQFVMIKLSIQQEAIIIINIKFLFLLQNHVRSKRCTHKPQVYTKSGII